MVGRGLDECGRDASIVERCQFDQLVLQIPSSTFIKSRSHVIKVQIF